MAIPTCSDKYKDIVNINVGGTLFVTTMETLRSVPDTRLSGISAKSPEYITDQCLYFFDRNPVLFHSVLDFYRTGELHLPKHVCGAAIRNELEFWQISSSSISDCCVSSLFKFEDELEVTNNLRRQFESKNMVYSQEQLEKSKWNRIKNVVWNIMDRPDSSRLARIYNAIYLMFVVTTCILFIMSNHDYFRTPIDVHIQINATHKLPLYDYLMQEHYNNPKLALFGSTNLTPIMYYLNAVCALFFIIEFIIRFVVCPARLEFLKGWLNIVDLIIVCSLLTTYVMEFSSDSYTNIVLLWSTLIMRSVIILRLIRLFRFAKHFSGLKILYLALKASFQELGLLGLTFMIATSLFGAFMFYAEFLWPTKIENMPIGIWWAIVTLTTVGYGDYFPVTVPGYFIGTLCSMCGLLLLSMPIAIIATNFNDYYNQNKIREKQTERKKDIFNKIKNLFGTKHVIKVDDFDAETYTGQSPKKEQTPRKGRLIDVRSVVDVDRSGKVSTPKEKEHNTSFNLAAAKVITSNRR